MTEQEPTGISIMESESGEFYVLLTDVGDGLRAMAATHREAATEYVELGERDLALAHGLFARQLSAEADAYDTAVIDWVNFGAEAEANDG